MSAPFTSYAQNGEDVVLWRALGHIEDGYYVDIGANDPVDDSITKAFYDRGWSGLDVEPSSEFAQRLRDQRPRSTVVEAAVERTDHGTVTLHEFPGTGLSSLLDEPAQDASNRGFGSRDVPVSTRRLDSLIDEFVGERDVHFCKIDVEGAEAAVLDSVDLTTWRPWIVVIEATAPNSTTPTHEDWEQGVLEAGYEFRLFDGLSRFYVAAERAEDIGPALDYPACVLDEYIPVELLLTQQELRRLQTEHHATVLRLDERERSLSGVEGEIEQLRFDVRSWRQLALESWGRVAVDRSSSADTSEVRQYQAEIDAMRNTLSWRVTRPLRSVRARLGDGE